MCQQTYNRFLLTYLATRQLTYHSRCSNVISTVKRIKVLSLICNIFSVFYTVLNICYVFISFSFVVLTALYVIQFV